MSGSSEEEDLAAAWGAALEEEDGGDGNPATPDATRVLNQAEIDSLLGFDSKGGEAGRRAGSRRSSPRGWCPMNACPCWRSSSTAWCG